MKGYTLGPIVRKRRGKKGTDHGMLSVRSPEEDGRKIQSGTANRCSTHRDDVGEGSWETRCYRSKEKKKDKGVSFPSDCR